jgi:hypothetical protein
MEGDAFGVAGVDWNESQRDYLPKPGVAKRTPGI